MPTSRSVSRLRVAALAVLLAGLVAMFLVGTMFPAQVVAPTGSLVKATNYTVTPSQGETAFNWLLALLVVGPAIVASAMLYSAAEIAQAVRRSSSRSRSHERTDLELGDAI